MVARTLIAPKGVDILLTSERAALSATPAHLEITVIEPERHAGIVAIILAAWAAGSAIVISIALKV